ncbi:SDR family oxidoreductase [Specibacter sp. RAF43]|uniref:SDR family oxidoreductase n=1 Tax=Specibacter sp. RAF43 TaxID=3233057 RepID=UPI003F9C39AF
MGNELVLVTGGSGFVGAHCIARLLTDGYRVRTTIRSWDREADVRAQLHEAHVDPGDALSFAVANLMDDAGWPAAVAGATYVLHTASPFPAVMPKDENDLIVPARDGALRVLRAARRAGVKRVVMTSSFAAVGYGGHLLSRPYTEEDWTYPTAEVSAYVKSKTIAERAAWDFMAREGGSLELAVINPVAILGPVLGPKLSSSVDIVRQLLAGRMPGVPKSASGIVDVRDVADLHVRAMISPDAKGQRFLAVSGKAMSLPEMARVLHSHLGADASRVSTRTLPNWLVRLASYGDPALRDYAPGLGLVKQVSNQKAREVLGWQPRPTEETLLATAESLLALDLVDASAG